MYACMFFDVFLEICGCVQRSRVVMMGENGGGGGGGDTCEVML